MSIDNTEIGRRLRIVRERNGLEQSDIAKMVGLSQSYISRVEKGQGKIMMPYLEIISSKLNTPLEYFLEENTHTEPIISNYKHLNTMTESAIFTEFFDALKRKDDQINRLINLQEKLFNKFENTPGLGEE